MELRVVAGVGMLLGVSGSWSGGRVQGRKLLVLVMVRWFSGREICWGTAKTYNCTQAMAYQYP